VLSVAKRATSKVDGKNFRNTQTLGHLVAKRATSKVDGKNVNTLTHGVSNDSCQEGDF